MADRPNNDGSNCDDAAVVNEQEDDNVSSESIAADGGDDVDSGGVIGAGHGTLVGTKNTTW